MLFGKQSQYPCENSGILSIQRALVVAILASPAVFTACGSHSTPPAPTSTASNSNLTISASLPPASVGTNYNASVQASGGSAPYQFSVASGGLPTGLGLSSQTGNITGTPNATGNFNFAVSVSDSKGVSQQKSLQIAVSNNSTGGSGGSGGSGSQGSGSGGGTQSSGGQGSAPSQPSGTTIWNLQRSGGWGQFGQGPPNFVDCSPSPCDGISFWMAQNVSSPSMSGASTEFNVGGSTPYSDALWNNHLIGPNSSQGMPDNDGSLVPSLHDFTYDVYFYASSFSNSQALEFDINQFFGNMGFIWGHECRIDSGNEWDVWDNQNARWVPTGMSCYPNPNSWNHLTIKVQRTSNNYLVYQSITFNGVTDNLNWSFGHGSSPNWYGVTINYQMDGDQRQDSYSVWLDNLNFTYE